MCHRRGRVGQLRRRDQGGAIAIISAMVAVVLLVVAAFVVDLGDAWARRGQLQVQADRAALLAAETLPATTDAQRTAAAEQVAYYIACHPVRGQRQLTPAIPDCPSGTKPSSASVETFAATLLSAGMVAFPTPTQVQVTTPPARVDFSFGRAAGAEGTTQRKTAVAKVSSPGDIVPMGLSMNCLLSVANNLPAGIGSTLTGVLPLNYVAPGPLTVESPATKWPTGRPESTTITIDPITPSTAVQGNSAGTAFTVTGSGWGALLPDVDVHFALGDAASASYKHAQVDTTVGASVLGVYGTATGTLPDVVANNPGTWRVKVAVQSAFWPTRTWSKQDTTFDVTLPTVTADMLGCGRLLKSPRNFQDGTPLNLQKNLQEGVDHALSSHPSMLTVVPPDLSVGGLLGALGGPGGLFKCPESHPHVKDTGGNLSAGKVPNCVVIQQGASTYSEFTEGMLGAPSTTATGVVAGRLVCTTSRPCRSDRKFTIATLPGREINDDRFDDFVIPERRNLLTEEMFFNLTTFLTPGLPVVTPQSALLPDIYSSHRFMWVPVLSTPVNPNTGNASDAGVYPILTFRPIFVTQDEPSGLDSVDMVLDLVELWVRTLLGISATDDHGVLMQGDQLRALRFMTIEPTALPAVPADYTGPTSEYVGVGPRVIQLVK